MAGSAAAQDFSTIANAAGRNETAEVESLVTEGGHDIDGVDEVSGRTALDFAAAFDNTDMASFLLSHGAHVDARDQFGDTALHWAAEHGSLRVLQLLIGAKAVIDAQNRQGLTPLMMAADHGQPAAARLLLKNGADPKKEDYTGRDAAQWAADKPAVLQVLSERR